MTAPLSESARKRVAELLPCPFCGGAVRLDQDGDVFAIHCDKPSPCIGSGLLQGFKQDKRDSAIAAWNSRAAITRDAEMEMDAAVGKEWRENSSLEKWFPFTADFLERAKARSEMANDLIDRALKMMQMAGYTVVEHNHDHGNPIIGWMASAKEFLPANYKRNPLIDAAIGREGGK